MNFMPCPSAPNRHKYFLKGEKRNMKPAKHAFTLVELTIVIAVIGILVAILIPTFANVIDKANAKSALSDARNTVTQYVIDAFDDKSLPNDLVIIIKKAGKFYLFGYDTKGDGKLKISNDNPFKVNPAETKQVIKDLSWNFKKGDDVLPEDDGTDYSNYKEYGAFYLIPYDAEGEPTVEIKGFHHSKDDELETKYPSFKTRMSENMGEDSDVYHGILLPGTFAYDSDTITTSDTTEISVTPTPAPKFNVTFDKGTLAGDENAIVPADQQLSIFIPASWASQCTYTYAANAEEWYAFDHFEKDGATIGASFAITEDTTITVVWKHMEAEKYRLTFDENNGTLDESTIPEGFTNGMQFLVNTDITSYINSIEAKRDNYTFGGWENVSTHVQYTSENPASNVIITEDTTLKAIWNEVKYNVTIDPNGGISEGHTDSYLLNADGYSQGEIMTLPTPTREGFNFTGWDSSVADEPTYGAGATYTMPGEDVTFTAKWALESKTITVTYYDEWNEEGVGSTVEIEVAGDATSITMAQANENAPVTSPILWQSSEDATISGTTATVYGVRHNKSVSGDSGTDYIVVTTYAGMIKIGGIYSDDNFYLDEATVNLTQNYWMLNDIVAEDYWYPLGWPDDSGTGDLPFTGKFDGNGKKLSNINMGYASGVNVGLFAVNSGVIRNLDIMMSSGGKIYGYKLVGSVAGTNKGLIEKIHVTGTGSQGDQVGTVIAQDGAVGGITGFNNTGATVRHCSVFVNSVEGLYQVGGIVGKNNGGTVEECYFQGTSANMGAWWYLNNGRITQIGGIVGDNFSGGLVQNCYVNIGGVIYTNYAGGGIVGYNREGATVSCCWVNANIATYDLEYYASDNGRGIGLNEGTSTGNYAVVLNNAGYAENGFNRILAATLTGYTSTSHPADWSTDIWDFPGSGIPTLKNWNRG